MRLLLLYKYVIRMIHKRVMNVEHHDALLILSYKYIIGRYPAYPSRHYLLLRTYILPRYTYYPVFF